MEFSIRCEESFASVLEQFSSPIGILGVDERSGPLICNRRVVGV